MLDFNNINDTNETHIARVALAVLLEKAITEKDKRLMTKVNTLALQINQASNLLAAVCDDIYSELGDEMPGASASD